LFFLQSGGGESKETQKENKKPQNLKFIFLGIET